MQAAQDMFIERGFEGVSMADIAERLGTSRPTIYGYFASTETILDALFEDRLVPVPRRIIGMLPKDQYLNYHFLLEALVKEKEALALLHSGGGPLFHARKQAFLKEIAEEVQDQYQEQYQVLLPEDQRTLLFPLVLNLLITVAYQNAISEKMVDLLARFIHSGIIGIAKNNQVQAQAAENAGRI